jgi:hypothetical protein
MWSVGERILLRIAWCSESVRFVLYRSSPPSVVLLSGSPVAKRVLLTTEIVVLMF